MVAQPRLAAVGGREIGDEVGESLHQLAQLVGQRGIVATEPRGERLALRFRHPRERGDQLLTFSRFPKAQWKTQRTTNGIERLHEEFRRRVKAQGSLPGEEAALILLFSLVAREQIRLRWIDGWRKIAAVLSQHTVVAA